jgi:hypothetical protein
LRAILSDVEFYESSRTSPHRDTQLDVKKYIDAFDKSFAKDEFLNLLKDASNNAALVTARVLHIAHITYQELNRELAAKFPQVRVDDFLLCGETTINWI